MSMYPAKDWVKTYPDGRIETINGPQNFAPAAQFTLANFANPTYVAAAYHPSTVQEPWDYSVYVYAYVHHIDSYTICVVSHAHISAKNDAEVRLRANWAPGHSYIPGLQRWYIPTPHSLVNSFYHNYNDDLARAVALDVYLGWKPGMKKKDAPPTVFHGTWMEDDRYPRQ